MKILLINYECPPLGGGGGVECYQIAKELAKKHQVDYLTTRYKDQPFFEEKDGVNIIRVNVLGRTDLSTATLLSMITFFPAALYRGIRLFFKNKYDIINTHFVIPSGLPAVILAKLFSKPHVISIIGGDIYDPSKKTSPHSNFFLKKLIFWLLRQATHIIAISHNTKENAIHYYHVEDEIEVIPLGFVKPKFQKVTREDLKLPSDKLLLISVGRLIKRKAYDTAIRSVSAIIRQGYDIQYLIVGDGPEEEILRKLVKEENIEDNVTFLGYTSEEKKFQYLSCSDIYLLSSLHEGFGICLLEAMYSGLPIVATNNGGQTDFLVNQRNVIFVPPQDEISLSNALEKLIGNKPVRECMADSNKKDIQEYYIEKIAQRYEKNLENSMIL